jgi:hypothetical protein
MDFRKKFFVPPGGKIKLAKIDPAYKGKHSSHQTATAEIARRIESLARLQYRLYAEGKRSYSARPGMLFRRTTSGFVSLPFRAFGSIRDLHRMISQLDRFQIEGRFKGLQVHLLEHVSSPPSPFHNLSLCDSCHAVAALRYGKPCPIAS